MLTPGPSLSLSLFLSLSPFALSSFAALPSAARAFPPVPPPPLACMCRTRRRTTSQAHLCVVWKRTKKACGGARRRKEQRRGLVAGAGGQRRKCVDAGEEDGGIGPISKGQVAAQLKT